jgi:hemolysin activation/secretion protein
MLKLSLITAALLAAGAPSAFAQQPVGGGGLLQQIPPSPTAQKTIPDIRVERSQTAPAPDLSGMKVMVRALHVTGQTRFSEAALISVSGFRPGREMSLSELRAMAAAITRYYNRNGYFVAQAYLPAQDIKDGTVTIAVVEGRYGKVVLRNKSRLSDHVALNVLRGLEAGDPVATAPLERRLLLLSDVPGVKVKSTLAPGTEPGSSDLIVDLTPAPFISGVIDADNAGSRYTGEIRGGGTINFNDITGNGDVASLRALTSGEGLTYVRGSYQVPIRNLTVGTGSARSSPPWTPRARPRSPASTRAIR